MAIGRDDGAEFFFRGAIAAVHVRMVDFYEVLIGRFDVVGLGMAGKAEGLESTPIVLVERLDALGSGALGLTVAITSDPAARGVTGHVQALHALFDQTLVQAAQRGA